jgi:hypothetical protein
MPETANFNRVNGKIGVGTIKNMIWANEKGGTGEV